jgi:8-oxo-dGTP pyrophosphatase MutT (NUDIX family)
MKTRPDWHYKQSAVIPYRKKDGTLEILLITSQNKGNWIIPKGIIEENLSPEESAKKEAEEEAGVKGKVGNVLIGKYSYKKWGGTCSVQVYALHVKEILDKWLEDDIRLRKWFPIKKAVKTVNKKSLAKILNEFRKNFESYKV